MSVNFRIVREQGNFSSGMYDVWEIVNEYNEQNWSRFATTAGSQRPVAMDTVSGIFRYLDFIFRMDQKRFGFDLSSGSIATKNESRLSRILRLISERSL